MSLGPIRQKWDERARDEFEDRVSILIFLAKMPEVRAVELAERMVRRRWRNGDPDAYLFGHPNALKRLS